MQDLQQRIEQRLATGRDSHKFGRNVQVAHAIQVVGDGMSQGWQAEHRRVTRLSCGASESFVQEWVQGERCLAEAQVKDALPCGFARRHRLVYGECWRACQVLPQWVQLQGHLFCMLIQWLVLLVLLVLLGGRHWVAFQMICVAL